MQYSFSCASVTSVLLKVPFIGNNPLIKFYFVHLQYTFRRKVHRMCVGAYKTFTICQTSVEIWRNVNAVFYANYIYPSP